MASATAISAQQAQMIKPLKPMGWMESILLFGIPAAALALSLLWLWPMLVENGILESAAAFTFCLTIVNAGLIVAALVGYVHEGNPMTWTAFGERMRFTRMTGRLWLWSIGSALLFGVMALLVNSFAAWIFSLLRFEIPAFTTGRAALWLQVVTLFFNILGEELWWRGYILPRQELAFGKATWFIHGILWACFHMYKWYAVPFMLITCQIIPFVAQRTRSTWPGIISHLFVNGAGVAMAYL